MGFWPEKREIAAYVAIRENLGVKFNEGEAIELLQKYYPKKVAFNLLKRLVKLGLAKKVGPFEYELVDLYEYVKERSAEYLKARERRHSSSSSS